MMKVIWAGNPSWRRILLRYGGPRKWRYWQNWRLYLYRRPVIITPFFRFTKCNGEITIGLGNHYIECGW